MEGFDLDSAMERWGYPESINLRVKPILQLLLERHSNEFENSICLLAENVLLELKNEVISAKEIDDLFMVIDLFIGEYNCVEEVISEDCRNIITEGMLFHDYEKEHGPNLFYIGQLINKIKSRL